MHEFHKPLHHNGHGLLAQITAQQRHQFATVDRFGDVVVATALKPSGDVVFFSTGGHENDGNAAEFAVSAHVFACFKAVEPRHDDIHKNQIGTVFDSAGYGVHAVFGREAFVIGVLFQNHFFHHQGGSRVVYQENFFRHRN